jgi:opacity protein-like surface antigen
MKRLPIFITLIMSPMVHAATPIDGWYAGAFGGYAYLPGNVNITSYGLTRSHTDYESGYHAGGSLGYKNQPMRYEGQITYLTAHLKKFTINNIQQTGVGGDADAVFAMANVYYDGPNWLNALQPFLGAGIGYGFVNARLNSSGPTSATQWTGQDSVFSYQAMAGLTYHFSEKYALNIGYRYLATDNAHSLGKSFQAQLAHLGVVYRFDGYKYT